MENVTLTLDITGLSTDGKLMVITDPTNYSTLTSTTRNSYGLFLHPTFRDSATIQTVPVTPYTPRTVTNWSVELNKDGRYTVQSFLFPVIGEAAIPLLEGDVRMNATDSKLYKWISGAWVLTTLPESIIKAFKSSNIVDSPVLAKAYTNKNLLNLEYIKAIKKEVAKGADQNKLFYKRTSLDYFSALISGAEYNWALSNFVNFYELVKTLNSIASTGKIE